MYAEIYKGSKLIDSGEWSGAKHWTKNNPEQSVYIIKGEDEVKYDHSDRDKVYFIEYESNGKIGYDSRTHIDYEEQRRQAKLKSKTECPTCGNKNATIGEMAWVSDRYGNPFKKCCNKCYSKTSKEISKWKLDPTYAGEEL